MHHEQDIEQINWIKEKIPMTYLTFWLQRT
jgi:hypothetical protein